MDFKYTLNIDRLRDSDNKVSEMRDGFGMNSGFFCCRIDFIAITKNDKGSQTLNFKLYNVHTSASAIAYLRMTNNDGKPSFQAPLLDKLMTILELNELSTNKEDVTLYFTEETYDVISEIKQRSVCIQLEKEWSKYNGKLYSRYNIRNFFRMNDYATANEIIDQKDFGKYFNSIKDSEYFTKVKYSNTDEKEVQYYLKNKTLPTNTNNTITVSDDEIPF